MKQRWMMTAIAVGTLGLSVAMAADTVPELPAPAPSDAEIAHIVVTADSVDIDAGKMALKKSKNAEVRKFAQQMVTDHGAVNKSAAALAKKLSLKPKDNATSDSLKKSGDDARKTIGEKKGHDFDKAYVDNEVKYHEAVLSTIDATLLPHAQNAELKALIEKVRPTIAAHLEHAKHIQADLDAKK